MQFTQKLVHGVFVLLTGQSWFISWRDTELYSYIYEETSND